MEEAKKTKKKRSKKIWVIGIVVIAVAAIFIFVKLKAPGSSVEYGEIGVEAVPLAMQDMSETINVTGKVESQNVWLATTDLTAKVKDLNVALGDRVQEGDVLLSFDESDVAEQATELEKSISTAREQSRTQNESAISNAEMALSQAQRSQKDSIATAQEEYEAAKKAYQEGKKKKKEGLPKSEKLKLDNELEAAKKAVESAQVALVKAQLAYQDGLDKDLSMSESIDLAQAVKDAQDGVVSAENALKQTQAAYKETMKNGSITDDELEKLKTAYEAAKRNLENTKLSTADAITSAENSLDTARASADEPMSESDTQLSKLQRQLNQMTIYAGQSGVVTQLNVSKGSIPNGTLLKIEDDSALKVNVSISEKDIVKIKEGMKATITSNALPGEEVEGTITQVINFASAGATTTDPSADGSVSSGSNYSANIVLEPGSHLLLGMSVKVNIAVSSEGENLAVSYDSIGYDENGDTYVMRATERKDGKYDIEKVPVTVGISNDYYSVIEGDVSEGDLIIMNPYMVTEGQPTELSVIDGNSEILYETDTSDSEG